MNEKKAVYCNRKLGVFCGRRKDKGVWAPAETEAVWVFVCRGAEFELLGKRWKVTRIPGRFDYEEFSWAARLVQTGTAYCQCIGFVLEEPGGYLGWKIGSRGEFRLSEVAQQLVGVSPTIPDPFSHMKRPAVLEIRRTMLF